MTGRVYLHVGVRLSQQSEIDPSGCHLWTGHVLPSGYAQIKRNGETVYAHRAAYEVAHGVLLASPRKGGPIICHRCDVRHCVNPEHLFLGSYSDNTRDMISKGRRVAKNQEGERNTAAKLTDIQAAAIKNDPRSQDIVAAEYGIRPNTVYLIQTGRLRKHLNRTENTK